MASAASDYGDLLFDVFDPNILGEEVFPFEQPSEPLALDYNQAMRSSITEPLSHATQSDPPTYRDNGSFGSPSSDEELRINTPGSGYSDGRHDHSPYTTTLRYASAQELAPDWQSGEQGVSSTAAAHMNHFPIIDQAYAVDEHTADAAAIAFTPEQMEIEHEHDTYSPMVLPHRTLAFITPQQQYFQEQQYIIQQLGYHAHPAQLAQPPMPVQPWQLYHPQLLLQRPYGEQRFVGDAPSVYVGYAQQYPTQSPTAQPVQLPPAQRRPPASRRVVAPPQQYDAYLPPRNATRHQQILPHGPVALPSTAVSRTVKKGGRWQKLDTESRAQASKTRKAGACWRCVMQRDICRGDGPCCDRCHRFAVLEYPGMYVLNCDRTKLPVLIGDFLPASMTHVHQKQIVLSAMNNDAINGVPAHGRTFTIWLTAGFGPDLSWPMVEFNPRDESVTTQFQFYQNPETRSMEKRDKYSPPFAIKSLSQEEESFEQYLDTILISGDHLYDFAELCYLAESRNEKFQENILTAMCTLYLETEDEQLQGLLKRILRMLVLTNIMVHTLTIVESRLGAALSQLERTPAPPQFYHQKHTSPKLANRQLKFFFSAKREEMYRELLKYGQGTLRASGDKDKSWIQMFILILGFAMVNEEIQSILQIQAVSKVAKGEVLWDIAQQEAVESCLRIDQKFELLIALFQHKYRSDKWTSPGSFGNQTPTLRDDATNDFLSYVRMQVEMNSECEETIKVKLNILQKPILRNAEVYLLATNSSAIILVD